MTSAMGAADFSGDMGERITLRRRAPIKMNEKPMRLDCISRTVISSSCCKSKDMEDNKGFKDHEYLTSILPLDKDGLSDRTVSDQRRSRF